MIEKRDIHQTQAAPNYTYEFEVKTLDRLKEYPKIFGSPHRHDFYFVLYLEKGNTSQAVDFKQYNMEAEQLLFMYPGQVHSFAYDKEAKGYTLYFTDSFLQNTNSSAYILHQYFYNKKQILSLTPKNDIRPIFEHLVQEFASKGINSIEVLKAYTEILLSLLLRKCMPSNTYNLNTKSIFFTLLSLQEKYYNKNTSIHDICKSIGISPKKLNIQTKEYFGKTFLQLLNERKLLEIKRLLSSSLLSSKEIAFQLGFSDTTYFNRFFKKHTTTTPLAYRQAAQQALGQKTQ